MYERLSRKQLYVRIRYAADDAGLDRMDRLVLAEQIFNDRQGIESFSELDRDELEDMLFVLRSWKLIQTMRYGNGSLVEEHKMLDSRLKERAHETAERQDEDGGWGMMG